MREQSLQKIIGRLKTVQQSNRVYLCSSPIQTEEEHFLIQTSMTNCVIPFLLFPVWVCLHYNCTILVSLILITLSCFIFHWRTQGRVPFFYRNFTIDMPPLPVCCIIMEGHQCSRKEKKNHSWDMQPKEKLCAMGRWWTWLCWSTELNAQELFYLTVSIKCEVLVYL